MKKSTLTFIIMIAVILIQCFSISVCFAETLDDTLNGLIAKRQIYETYLSDEVFSSDIESETEVDNRTGSFSFRQTDYSLPGRSGLDLEITRIYRSGMSSLYENTAYHSGSAWVNVIEGDWESDDFYSFYEERYNLGSGMRFSFPTIEAVKTSSDVKYLYLHTETGAVYRMVGPKLNEAGVNEYALEGYELKDITIRDVTEEDSEILPQYTTNGVTNVPKYVLIDKHGTRTYFSDKDSSGDNAEKYEGRILAIVDRYGNMIKFEYSTLSYTVDGHTKVRKLITKIIDTVGREVNIEYLQDASFTVTEIDETTASGDLEERFNIKITTPDGQMLVYRKTCMIYHGDTLRTLRERIQNVYRLQNADEYDDDGDGLFDRYVSDRLYFYWYEKADNKFDYNGEEFKPIYVPGLGEIYNRWETINFIRYSQSKAKYIEYTDGMRKLGVNGRQTYRKVCKEVEVLLDDYEILDDDVLVYTGKDVKTLNYTYENEPDGANTSDMFTMIDFESEDDLSYFEFKPNSDDCKWTIVDTTSADGDYCLKSATTLSEACYARIETYFWGSATLSFDYKLSYDKYYEDNDNFFVEVNNSMVISLGAGKSEWQHYSCNLASGNNVIDFYSNSWDEDDCVYLDNISIGAYYSTTVADAYGNSIEYLYNGDHTLINTFETGNEHFVVTYMTYDDNNLPRQIEKTTTIMENGEAIGIPTTQTERFEYDDYGNLIRYVPPLVTRKGGGEYAQRYGKVDGKVLYAGETLYSYDIDKFHKLSKCISATSTTNLVRTDYTNDEMGNTILEVSQNIVDDVDKSKQTTYTYDEYGNMISKHITENGSDDVYSSYYEYGSIGESSCDKLYLTRSYSGNSASPIFEKRYSYNFLNGLQTEMYEYNNETADELVTKYTYDKKYRLKKVNYPDGSNQYYNYYENGYNSDKLETTDDMVVEIWGQDTDIMYTYDVLGNLISTYEYDATKYLSQYEYDENSNLIKETDANGHSIRYEYNSKNDLIKKSYWENDTVEKDSVTISYNTDIDKIGFEMMTDVKQVATGDRFTIVVKNDGTVWTWGSGDGGKLGRNEITSEFPKRVDELSDVKKVFISYSDETCYALKNDGTVWSWGKNNYGLLGRNITDDVSVTPEQIPGLSNVVDIVPSMYFVCALTGDGNVYSWGLNNRGQLGDGTTNNSGVPVPISGLTDITMISAGNDYGVGLRNDGTVWTWGANACGQLGRETDETTAGKVKDISDIKYVYAAKDKTGFAIDNDGQLWGWGNNFYRQLCNLDENYKFYPIKINLEEAVSYICDSYNVDGDTIFAVTESGNVYGWGRNWYSLIDSMNQFFVLTPRWIISDVKALYNHDIESCFAVKNDGTVYSWGFAYEDNAYLGYWNNTESREPVQVPGLVNIKSMSISGTVRMALTEDGRLYGWGRNTYSQIGENYTVSSVYAPVPVTVKNDNPDSGEDYDFSMTLTDEDGFETIYYYDNNNQLMMKEETKDNQNYYITKYDYDAWGNKISVTDANGGTTTFVYDNLNRLSQKTDALGNTTTYRYNAVDKLSEKIEPDNKITKYYYDSAGRIVLEKVGLTDSIDSIYNFKLYESYDKCGNLLSYKQGHTTNGETEHIIDAHTKYVYNGKNQVKEQYDLIEGDTYRYTCYQYNKAGNKTLERVYANGTTTDEGYIETRYVYDSLQRNTETTTKAYYKSQHVGTNKIKCIYDNGYNVIEKQEYVSSAEYLSTFYEYDYANRIISSREPIGINNDERVTNYSYDGRGNLTEKTLVMGDEKLTASFEYDGMGNLISETNALNQMSRYGYDAVGNRIIETDPRFADEELDNANGMRFTYDALNRRIKSEVYADGDTEVLEQRSYDGRGNVVGITLGNSTTASKMEYDASDNMIKYTSADVAAKSESAVGRIMTYDSLGHILTSQQYINDIDSNTTVYQYYGTGLLKSVVYPDSLTPETYMYDNTGKLYEQRTVRNGGVLKICKSLFGLPYETEYPDGTTETYTLDWYMGLALAFVDKKKRRRKYRYDKSKNLIEERFNYDNNSWLTTKYSYDEWDNLISTETFDRVMDSDNNITAETSLGNKVTYTYDDAFRNTGYYDETGREQLYEYDAAGNLVKQMTKVDTLYDIQRYEYDAIGRITADIMLVPESQLSNADEYQNDSEYENMKVLTTSYTYIGNYVQTETTPRGYETVYSYDAAYNVISIEYPHSNVLSYEYDYAGQLVYESISDGVETFYEYDEIGQNTVKYTYAPNGNKMVWAKEYDNMGNVINESTPELYALGECYTYDYDIMGQRLSVQDADGNILEVYAYDECGNLMKKVDAQNAAGTDDISALNGDVYMYDAFDRVISWTDALGNITSYEYDLQGNLTKEINARGYATVYKYNADYTLASVDYPDGGQVKYTYDKKGRATSECIKQTDDKDIIQTYSYTPFDKVHMVTDPYDNTIINLYDADGNLTQVTDKNGNTSYISYDGNNRIIKQQMPMSDNEYQIRQYTYNNAGMILSESIVGTSTRITDYSYQRGYLTSVSNSGGQQTIYEYDDYGNNSKVKHLRNDAEYDEVRYEYDKYGRNTAVVKVMSADSVELPGVAASNGEVVSRQEYVYDVLGNTTIAKAPMAFVEGMAVDEYTTQYTYDALSRMMKAQTSYDGGVVTTEYAYDEIGNNLSVTDARGGVTKYSYDSMNRVQSITNADNVTTSYEYDYVGNKVTENKSTGSWRFEYDLLNRLTICISPQGNVVSKNVYDANDNIVKKIDGEGYANGEYGITYEYNKTNQVISCTLPEGGTTKYEYNTFGEQTIVTDPSGNSTYYTYDNSGNLLSVTDGNNNTTTYTYDKIGNRLSVTDANGNTTGYSYGAFGTLTAITDAAGRSQTYKYNLTGKITSMVDRVGNVTEYTYNSLDMLTDLRVTKMDGTADTISYSYDCLGNRITMNDATGSYAYSYDAIQRLISVSKDETEQISYTYTEDGYVKSASYGGTVTDYTYDADGNLTQVTNGSVTADYAYDLSGNLITVNYGGGSSETITYNKNNAIVSVTNKDSSGSVVASYAYTYDACGRQISKTDKSGTTTYKYDSAGQITEVVMPQKTSVYTYDAAGNRSSVTETYSETKSLDSNVVMEYNKNETLYEYSVCNELMQTTENMYDSSNVFVGSKTTAYTYDANGNQYMATSAVVYPADDTETTGLDLDVAEEPASEFTSVNDVTISEFDGFNRLVKKAIIKNEVQTITEYAYNGDGLRTSKIVKKSSDNYAAHKTNYLYDGQYVVMETGDSTATYVRGMNYIAKIGTANGIYYYMYNAHGDVVQVVGTSGTVENTYEYDPFGETVAKSESVENAIMYAGEFCDESAALYYLRARYYDPAIGRFISEDSYRGYTGDPASLNLYTYCKNDPISFIDPTGHVTEQQQKNIESAFHAWKGGIISRQQYEDNVRLNGGTVSNNSSSGSKKNSGSKSSSTSKNTGSSSGLKSDYSNAIWNNYGEIIGYNPNGGGYTDKSQEALNIHGGGAQAHQPIYAIDSSGKKNRTDMYSGMTGLATLVFDEEVDIFRDSGWYASYDTVEVFSAYDLTKSEAYGHEIYEKLNGDSTGSWYTKYIEVDLFDATTGDYSTMPAWQAYGYVQGGLAYTAYQSIPESTYRQWALVDGLRNIGLDPLASANINGSEMNYIQFILEDKPYISTTGAGGRSPSNKTAMLNNIFSAMGMNISNSWVYDNWSTLAAVDTIQGKYWEIADSGFYDNLAEYIIMFAAMSEEELSNTRGILYQAQQSYKNNLILGQRLYEAEQRRLAELARQKRIQQQARRAQQAAVRQSAGVRIEDALYPNTRLVPAKDSYLKRSLKQVVLGNYTDDVTLAGTAGQVALGFVGLDAPADIRDLYYDVTNWEWSWEHAGRTALDVAAVVPIVGSMKYADEAGAVVKNADELLGGAKSVGRMTNSQATEAAKKLGFERTTKKTKTGELIFYNSKKKIYISQDVGSSNGLGSHNGGVWKAAKSPEALNSKTTRMGTYDANLNRIGD